MRNNIIIILALILAGCGPASKLRRAKKLIAQAEASGLEWKSDTVFQVVEVVVPKIEFDTVLRQVNFIDTLVVEKNKVVTRVKVNTITKEVYIKTTCPEQKKKVVVTHTVTKTIKVGDGWLKDLAQTGTAFIAALIIGAILSKMFWK